MAETFESNVFLLNCQKKKKKEEKQRKKKKERQRD